MVFLEKNFSQRRKDHEKGEEIYHGVEVRTLDKTIIHAKITMRLKTLWETVY